MNLMRELESAAVPVTQVHRSFPDQWQMQIDRPPPRTVGDGASGAGMVPLARKDAGYRIMNTIFDISLCCIALPLLLPLFLFIATAIKITSPGPVLFRQDRHGLHGKIFRIYKFRTMATDAGDASGVAQTVRNDPRVTSIGRLLRKTSFDELPQLFNILRREMSIVGPRPHVPGMLANGRPYEEFDHRYMLRHQVRPGLTGLAQVQGHRGETCTADAALKRLEADLDYIRRQSIRLDIEITLRTFWREFIRGSGY